MTQKLRCGCNSLFLSISPEIKQLLFYEKLQEVLSPVSASFIAKRSGPVKTVQLNWLIQRQGHV